MKAVWATVFLVSLTIGSWVAPPWVAVEQIILYLLGRQAIPLSPIPWSEKFLGSVLCLSAIWLVNRNFVNWNGAVSVRHHEMDRLHEKAYLFIEAMVELKRCVKRAPPLEVYSEPSAKPQIPVITPPNDVLAWRDVAKELIELTWTNYSFDSGTGWHAKGECWIGEDTQSRQPIALICTQQRPTDDALKTCIEYVAKIAGSHPADIQFVLAAREDSTPGICDIGGCRVHCTNEESLLDGLVDFSDYIADIRKRVERERLPDSAWTLPDIYTSSRLADRKDDQGGTPLEKYIANWVNEPGQRQLAILGEYGQGKSTGVLMFTYKQLCSAGARPKRIPVLIELRGKSPSTLQPTELLSVWASRYRISPRALLRLLIAGRIMMVFEGFDEMADIGSSQARFGHFKSLWRFCYPQAKLLFTGRPNLFPSEEELNTALGIGAWSGTGPYCHAVHLKPFDIDQIRDSLRWCAIDVQDEITRLAEKNDKFRDIAARPSLLYIIGHLWRHPEFAEMHESVDSAKVMGAFIDHCCKRQTEKERQALQFMVLNERERRFFMEGIAAFMGANELPNQMGRAQFEKAVSDLYMAVPDDFSFSGGLMDELSQPLRTRFAGREDEMEVIQTSVRTYGLLAPDYSRTEDVLKFPHRSFYEFLFAVFIVAELSGRKDPYWAAIRNASRARVDQIAGIPQSASFAAELFVSEFADDADPGAVVDSLLDRLVFSTRVHLPTWAKRIWLTWGVFVYRWPRRHLVWVLTAWLAVPMMIMLSAMGFPHFPAGIGSNTGMAVAIAVYITAFPIVFRLLITRFSMRRMVLWYTIARQLLSEAALEQSYGRTTISHLSGFAVRSRGHETGGNEATGSSI